MIKYGEQKLLYYEREDVSCAIKYGQIQLCVYCTYILYMCVLCTYVCVCLCGGSLYSMPANLTFMASLYFELTIICHELCVIYILTTESQSQGPTGSEAMSSL